MTDDDSNAPGAMRPESSLHWICPFCGKEARSYCDGADAVCCGEVGHCIAMTDEELTANETF